MTKELKVPRENGGISRIIIGPVAEHLPALTADRRVIVITDPNLRDAYPDFVNRYEHIVIGLGEEHKTMDTLAQIYARLIELGADRTTLLLGFGGGIVTDVTGFAASTYMRGLDFGFVATTLLSQVDASVGGKNGVNFEGYKNMVGVFNQPGFVICDTSLLATLPEREVRSGLAEVVKSALIANPDLVAMLEGRSYADIAGNKPLIDTLVYETIRIKADIVGKDEKEHGERKKLNLGHTVAHAIEKSSRRYLHGEAVAIGLTYAARISKELGKLTEAEEARITAILNGLGLPVRTDIPKETLFNALKIDKKKESDSIHFIVMNGIGACEIVKLPFDRLKSLL